MNIYNHKIYHHFHGGYRYILKSKQHLSQLQKYLLITLILSLLVLSLYPSPLRVFSSNENEVAIEWVLPAYQLEEIEIDGIIYHNIVGDFDYFHSREGYPKLPFISENVGIPPNGDIELYLSKTETKTLSNVLIYPSERIAVKSGWDGKSFTNDDDYNSYKDNLEMTSHFYRNNNAYRSRANYPAEIVSKGVTAYAADRHFASFIFNPFIYNAASKELTVITSAVITVRILGDKTKTRNFITGRSYIDRAGDLFFLNDESSRYWRKERDYAPDYSPTRNTGISEVQFVVDQEGIYKVTYEDLAEHLREWREVNNYDIDFNIDRIDPRYLELSSQYGVAPIHFQGERTGSFDPGDYFEFYGQRNFGKEGYSDAYTAENVYTLRIVENWGARMAVESGGVRETNPRNYILPQSYEHLVHFEEQNTYSNLSSRGDPNFDVNYREDLWFWKTIRAPDLSVTPFRIEYPHQTFMRGLTVNVMLVGSTDTGTIQPDHHARVRINSAFINSHQWRGQRDRNFTNTEFVSNEYLNHGTNYLYIDMPGDTPAGRMEAIFLDYFNLKYWREYKTDSDYIKFTKPSNRPLGLYQFELDNFSTNDVFVYKINSSIIENLQIEPFSETGLAPYRVTFQDVLTSNNTEYIAVTSAKKLKPKVIRPRFPSELKNPDIAADCVIVTGRDFIDIEGTQLFIDSWQSRGFLVKVVDIQNIFDEFNYGIRSADAMKDFFRYAYNNWAMPMTDVLLLGKGIYDERDFSVHRVVNLIPYKNIWTWKLGATPSDNWFACIVGNDNVPDFNIARITAWNEDQVLAVARKTAHHKDNLNFQDLWQPKVTLVAGGQAGTAEDIFARQNEQIRNRWIPQDYHVTRVYSTTDIPEYRGGTFKLKDSWDTGTSFIQFMGHGGGRIWADYNLLNNNDIRTLNNNNYPFVNSLSCYPSDFSRPGVGSIGENMILTANRGAIAHFGFSGLGYLNEDLTVGLHLAEAIFHRKLNRFGEIVSYTKARTYASIFDLRPQTALVQAALLFGDPMLGFNLPEDRVNVTLSKHNITEGDTLRFTVNMGEDINYARFHIQLPTEVGVPGQVPFDIPVINGIFTAEYPIPVTGQTNYRRIVKVYGYGTDRQVLGMSGFTVGRAAVVDNVTIPNKPTNRDSIHIAARLFDERGIRSVVCRIGNVTRQMQYDELSDRYTTVQPFAPQTTSILVSYRFIITTNNNQQIETDTFTFHVWRENVRVTHLEFTSKNNKPAVKAYIKNNGDYPSKATKMTLFQRTSDVNTYLNEVDIPPLQPLEEKQIYLEIPPVRATLRFRGEVAANNTFFDSEQLTLNMFYAGVADTTVYSLDNNLKIDFPANLFSSQEILYIAGTPYKQPLNQPDVHKLSLADSTMSNSYKIGIFNTSVLQDTTGTLPDNKRIRITLNYNPEHQQTINWQSLGRFAFYRWLPEFNAWTNQGGFTDTNNHLVFQEINRLGTYTILHNNDTTSPTIRANVQDQEFTYGGYISGNGVISLLLSDANGIDAFDRDIQLFLNGVLIPEEDYTVALNSDNINAVPIKYQLDLDAGNYTLFITCSDVNGNTRSHDINFVVSTKFDVINLANYPNPVVTNSIDPVNANRTRFTYVLTDDADNVKIKIYTVSGRLVKTFDNLPKGVGYHEYPRTVSAWDCRDDKGIFLANGIYFYKILATKNNQTVERIQRMAIAR